MQIDLSTLEQLVVDAKTAADNFSISYDNSNTGGNENPGDNPENPGDNPENPGDNPENPGDNPENPGDNPENPGDDPENPIDTTDYTKLEMFENVDDVWTMKELPEDLTKYSEQTSVSYNIPAGEEVAIDIDMLLSNKEKLEKANVPVSLNIPSDSTISFQSEGYPGMDFTQIKPIMDFVLGDIIDEYKNASDKTKVELPNMDLTVYNDMIGDGNLYGTGVDKVIEMYYNTDNEEKLNYENKTPSSARFDAVDALQDGKMYDEENNFIDTYALDINAALLMGAGIGNVKVVGENKTEIMDRSLDFHNTRFETDLTGFVFNGMGYGIIDYAESAPALTLDGSYGKTIIRKPSENMIVKGGHTLDLSNVENSSLLDNISDVSEFSEIYYKTQEDATRGFSGAYIDAIYIGDKLYSKDNTYTPVNATNQQWIDASNNDLWSEGQNSLHYPKDVHNEAEEWADTTAKLDIKTVNKDILQKILENNQKSYS